MVTDRPDGRTSALVEDDPDQAAIGRAPATLGWTGVALPKLTVFGRQLHPIVELDFAVH